MFLNKQKTTVAVIADTHIGSTISLCLPKTKLDDGSTIQISQAQQWLHQNWSDFWDFATQLNKKLYLFVLGDVFDNLHHGTTQLWSTNEVDWKKAALELFDLPCRKASHKFVVRGTLAHTKPGGSLDEEFALMLKAEQTETGTYSSWRRKVYVEGVLFDLAHKGPMGLLPWTQGNILNRYAYQVLAECHKKNQPMPDVVLRGHNHLFDTSTQASPTFIVGTPAWQLCTEYGYNRDVTRLSDIGGLVFECWDGKYEFHKRIYVPEEAKPWKE